VSRLGLAAVAALVLPAAGCGGSKARSVASLSSTTTSTSGSGTATRPVQSLVAFADCMTAHGVPASPGAGGHGVMITGGDPRSPQSKAAQGACQARPPATLVAPPSGRLERREADLDVKAALGSSARDDRRPVGGGDRPHDREAEPHAG
jgi:hypothetical protein